jgi:RimJ/RimL family protein N-acetyltransferase
VTESTFSIEPLWTARLLLDPLVGDSKVAAEMVQVLADPALYLHTGGAPPTVSELSARYTRQARGGSADETEVWFNWIVRAAGEAVGYVQVTLVRSTGVADLAWLIGTAFQRRGYATEAAAAVRDWLASRPDVSQMTAHISPANIASAGVATGLGLTATNNVEDGELVWALTVDR